MDGEGSSELERVYEELEVVVEERETLWVGEAALRKELREVEKGKREKEREDYEEKVRGWRERQGEKKGKKK